MTTDYRYKLETPRLTGRRQEKVVCPQCGRKSFVRYVDTYDGCSYISDAVGKCDHEHSCGYHYKPSEYFRDNEWLKTKVVHYQQPKPQLLPPPLQPLPAELVGQYHSPNSTFWQWFTTKCAEKLKLDSIAIERVYEHYLIGADERHNVVFWQLDAQGRLRTGHIMQYQQDGHRHDGYQDWVHNKLKKLGKLPEGWPLYQCLFGEHLLPQRPDDNVCLVESEKTAIVMAALLSKYIWLATGGSCGFSQEKLNCLKGRRVTVFPDSGCYKKWHEKLQHIEGINYTITDSLESYPSNTDFADLLHEPP